MSKDEATRAMHALEAGYPRTYFTLSPTASGTWRIVVWEAQRTWYLNDYTDIGIFLRSHTR